MLSELTLRPASYGGNLGQSNVHASSSADTTADEAGSIAPSARPKAPSLPYGFSPWKSGLYLRTLWRASPHDRIAHDHLRPWRRGIGGADGGADRVAAIGW